jgi:hypothetical protein
LWWVAAVAAVALLGWVLWSDVIDTRSSGYDSARKAVQAACGPTEVLSVKQLPDSSKFMVAWRGGIIWAALVTEDGGRYNVVKCRWHHVPHG